MRFQIHYERDSRGGSDDDGGEEQYSKLYSGDSLFVGVLRSRESPRRAVYAIIIPHKYKCINDCWVNDYRILV